MHISPEPTMPVMKKQPQQARYPRTVMLKNLRIGDAFFVGGQEKMDEVTSRNIGVVINMNKNLRHPLMYHLIPMISFTTTEVFFLDPKKVVTALGNVLDGYVVGVPSQTKGEKEDVF